LVSQTWTFSSCYSVSAVIVSLATIYIVKPWNILPDAKIFQGLTM